MDRRPAAVFHIGALPISIEIKPARRDAPTGNVVMLVRTATPKRGSKRPSTKSRKPVARQP